MDTPANENTLYSTDTVLSILTWRLEKKQFDFSWNLRKMVRFGFYEFCVFINIEMKSAVCSKVVYCLYSIDYTLKESVLLGRSGYGRLMRNFLVGIIFDISPSIYSNILYIIPLSLFGQNA